MTKAEAIALEEYRRAHVPLYNGQELKLDGVVFGFLDYNEELKYFDSAVMPLLRRAGLRS